MKRFHFLQMIFVTLLITTLSSCEKKDNSPNPSFLENFYPTSDNPVLAHEWLKKEKDNVKTVIDKNFNVYIANNIDHIASYIRLYKYDGKTFYFVYINNSEGPKDIPLSSKIYTSTGEIYLDNVSDPRFQNWTNEEEKNFFKNAAAGDKLWQYLFDSDSKE